MGGFLIINNKEKKLPDELDEEFKNSLNIFKRRGLELKKKFSVSSYTIYAYSKYTKQSSSCYEDLKGNFILIFGTCFYKGEIGPKSAERLYKDFIQNSFDFNELSGNFAVILHNQNQIFVFNDYLGLYRIYVNDKRTIISSSYLAIHHALKTKTLSEQELYEYVFNGAFYGDSTIYKEINLLNNKFIWQLTPALNQKVKNIEKTETNNVDFEQSVETVTSSLLKIVQTIKPYFGDNCTMGLTGGFDSRLMLAALLRSGITPDLYVYGDANSPDVKIAKEICQGEGLDIRHVDRDNTPGLEINKFLEIVKKNYFYFDGLGNTGILNDGTDINERFERTREHKLQINGGGGEVFRDFWKLPDKPISIRTFLRSRYNHLEYFLCKDKFNSNNYFSNLEEKIKSILSIDRSWLTRQEVTHLYPFMRLKYWMSINVSINSYISDAINLLVEPSLVFHSFTIPLKYKQYGKFESALIRKLSPKISKYSSSYGAGFESDMHLTMRIVEWSKMHAPVCIRPYIKNINYLNKFKSPYYLNDKYLSKFINLDRTIIGEYIKLNKLPRADMYSRALSLEILFENSFI